jgi:putative membrane protein
VNDLWLKALHIISFTAWMAALFYLPRLFVYHAAVNKGSEADTLFRIMERRLQRIIMTPAMLLTFTFGLLLIHANPSALMDGWLHSKLGLVLILATYHGYLCVCRKKFATGENQHSGRFYRILNEVPTVLLVGIVVLAVVKPF